MPTQRYPSLVASTAMLEEGSNEDGMMERFWITFPPLEGGHAAWNVLLQATALDWGAVSIGAFRDDGVKEAFRLPGNQEPLYRIPVGHSG
jgi:nitroreductase